MTSLRFSIQTLSVCFLLTTLAVAADPVESHLGYMSGSNGYRPVYGLDQMTEHPYRFTPAYGHASQIPGSPKYFVPGYGYRIPGFGSQALNLNSYSQHYAFGVRKPGSYTDATHQYWDNAYGGPWYYPGSSTNLKTRWPNW